MDEHWQHKKKRSGAMSNPEIDKWYDLAMRNGAVGGKLIGAGGGGFLLFYTEDKKRVRHAMREAGLEEVRLRFDSKAPRRSSNDQMPPLALLAGGLATRLRPQTCKYRKR